jgi:hypothetical protein
MFIVLSERDAQIAMFIIASSVDNGAIRLRPNGCEDWIDSAEIKSVADKLHTQLPRYLRESRKLSAV